MLPVPDTVLYCMGVTEAESQCHISSQEQREKRAFLFPFQLPLVLCSSACPLHISQQSYIDQCDSATLINNYSPIDIPTSQPDPENPWIQDSFPGDCRLWQVDS